MEKVEYIGREAAVSAVHERIRQIGFEDVPSVLSIRQAVYDVPVAKVIDHVRSDWFQVWETGSEDFYRLRCGECSKLVEMKVWDGSPNFCPNCGADMRKNPDG